MQCLKLSRTFHSALFFSQNVLIFDAVATVQVDDAAAAAAALSIKQRLYMSMSIPQIH
jgi:hypothetical protein